MSARRLPGARQSRLPRRCPESGLCSAEDAAAAAVAAEVAIKVVATVVTEELVVMAGAAAVLAAVARNNSVAAVVEGDPLRPEDPLPTTRRAAALVCARNTGNVHDPVPCHSAGCAPLA